MGGSSGYKPWEVLAVTRKKNYTLLFTFIKKKIKFKKKIKQIKNNYLSLQWVGSPPALPHKEEEDSERTQ